MRNTDSQDSYPLKVYLSAEAIAFLESKHPNVDPEIGIVHLVNEVMYRAKRTAAARVQVLKHPAYATTPSTPLPPPKETEPTSQPQVALPSQSQPSSNPIGTLQEYCQQAELPLPKYQFEPCAEGFACQVSAKGQSASGTGANKKTAKANAAVALLAELRHGQ